MEVINGRPPIILISLAGKKTSCENMVWDVYLQPAKKGGVLGSLSQVLQLLKDNVPGIDLSNPTYGIVDQKDLAMEFVIGKDDPVQGIMLSIHAAGDFEKIEETIKTLCKNTTWRARDMTSGSFLH